MAELKRIKRPSAALIKLVESIGILLEVKKSDKKSFYKAPIPTNYDNTLEELDAGYSDIIGKIAALQSQDVANEIASEFFAKTLEPGFSYQAAVDTGGLCARDLFNAITLVIVALQTDENRIPITPNNIFVIASGSRSSYAALDIATHIFKHGVITINGCIVEDALPERECVMLKEHLYRDLLRRAKLLYKLPDHCFSLNSMLLSTLQDAPDAIVGAMETNDCRTLVLGIEEDANFGYGGDGGLPMWAATNLPSTHTLILVKGRSKVRPFTSIQCPRSFLLYIDSGDFVNPTFLSTLALVRPSDTLTIIHVAESSAPLGDSRDDRLGMGTRAGWVVEGGIKGHSYDPTKSYRRCQGWNDEATTALEEHLNQLLTKSKISGTVMIERQVDGRTISQSLCGIAVRIDADAIVLRRCVDLSSIIDTVQESNCSIVLL